MKRLERAFFDRPTLTVARELLGCALVRMLEGQRLAGTIVEVEAYIGESDRACHAARGRTPRNSVMYGLPGLLYVYFTYGMHHCANMVTEREGFPAAVLLRAVHPADGISHMMQRRGRDSLQELTSGPAKLCQAMAIDRALNGEDLTTSPCIWVEPGNPIPEGQIATGPRIGVARTGEAALYPWRFWLPDDPCVSRPRRIKST